MSDLWSENVVVNLPDDEAVVTPRPSTLVPSLLPPFPRGIPCRTYPTDLFFSNCMYNPHTVNTDLSSESDDSSTFRLVRAVGISNPNAIITIYLVAMSGAPAAHGSPLFVYARLRTTPYASATRHTHHSRGVYWRAIDLRATPTQRSGKLRRGNAVERERVGARTEPSPLVATLVKGTPSQASFIHFIKCEPVDLPSHALTRECRHDYHYVNYYACAYSLLAAKSAAFPLIASTMQAIMYVLRETAMHRAFWTEFGISEDELARITTTTYGCHLMDIGIQAAHGAARMLLRYGEVGLLLKCSAARVESDIALEGHCGVEFGEGILALDVKG
ncbi:hypothetical protein B0H17DRAFT_1190560 [Mycena rosella]|uniref:Uncharacterized protein n=1 Tax=Mycena rosella TaxID=1033263 RepID=A0AAD7H3E7_MYCRO|nr:hypothetical protein B0H17DRAFT_1190560 [Mycena rosella]